jgi:hypothetical protein
MLHYKCSVEPEKKEKKRDMVERASRVMGENGYQKRERVSRIEGYGDVE